MSTWPFLYVCLYLSFPCCTCLPVLVVWEIHVRSPVLSQYILCYYFTLSSTISPSSNCLRHPFHCTHPKPCLNLSISFPFILHCITILLLFPSTTPTPPTSLPFMSFYLIIHQYLFSYCFPHPRHWTHPACVDTSSFPPYVRTPTTLPSHRHFLLSVIIPSLCSLCFSSCTTPIESMVYIIKFQKALAGVVGVFMGGFLTPVVVLEGFCDVHTGNTYDNST